MRKKLCPLLIGDKTKWPKCYKKGNLDIVLPKGCFSKCGMLVPMLKKRLIASQLVTKMSPQPLLPRELQANHWLRGMGETETEEEEIATSPEG